MSDRKTGAQPFLRCTAVVLLCCLCGSCPKFWRWAMPRLWFCWSSCWLLVITPWESSPFETLVGFYFLSLGPLVLVILKQVIKSGVNFSCCYFVCSLRSTICKRMGKLVCYNTQPHLKGITAMFSMSEWVSGWKLILKVNSSQSDVLKEKHLFPEVYYGMDTSLILWHLFLDLGSGVFEQNIFWWKGP